MTEKDIQVKVLTQGTAEVSQQGYWLYGSKDSGCVGVYLDAWGKTGRAYLVCSCDGSYIDGEYTNTPSMCIECGSEEKEDEMYTEICFPEFEGWSVFAVRGGKTMSICLVKPE